MIGDAGVQNGLSVVVVLMAYAHEGGHSELLEDVNAEWDIGLGRLVRDKEPEPAQLNECRKGKRHCSSSCIGASAREKKEG